MIKIKYVVNPFEDNGYKVIYLDPEEMLVSSAKESIRKELGGNISLIRDGVTLKDSDVIKQEDDIVVVSHIEWEALVAIGAVLWDILVVAYWIGVVYAIYSFFTMSKPSNGSTSSGMDEGSPTYSWDGITTTSDVGIPLAIVYGEHRVGGNMINAYISTSGDDNYLNMLIALCEGEVESISDIRLNDQPSANFGSIDLYTDRVGTNSDAVIPNFEDLRDNYSIGQSLNDINDDYIYTTASSVAEGFEVQISFPQGLFQSNQSNGNILAWDVGIKVEYKLHTDPTYTTAYNVTVSEKQRTNLRRYYRVDGLTAGEYDIKVTRTTDTSDFYHIGAVDLSYIVEIRTDDLAYPNTAKLGFKALATNQISGTTPNVTSLIKGKKIEIPKVMYDGSEVDWEDYYWDSTGEEYKRFSDDVTCTWDGSTWVTRFSANPIWCMRDLVTNTRYGLGDHISSSQMDRDALLDVSRYCEEPVSDGAGGMEKRLRLDIVLDSTGRALDTLMQMVSSFRGIFLYSGEGFRLEIDRPTSPVQLFGQGNIIAKSFSESFKVLKDVPNVIEVQYMDKDEDYKQQLVSIIDEESIANDEPIRKQSLRMFVTRKSQALREARFALLSKKMSTRSVIFKTSTDALACQPGDVISVSSDVTQWGFSGRVKTGSTTTSVVLDRDVTVESGKTYDLMVRYADDTLETQTVNNAPGTTNVLTFTTPFASAPADYDVYCFGGNGAVKKDFRIVNMKRTGDLEVEISAIEYDVRIYDIDSIVLPTYNSSALSLEPGDVQDLALTERLVRQSDGTIDVAIDVWWRNPDANSVYVLYKEAKVYISDNAGASYALMGKTEGESFSIVGGLEDLTEYIVKVVTVNSDGSEMAIADAPSSAITLVGKSAPPADVVTFLLNQSRDRLVFTWSENTDTDLFGYEIRTGDSWDAGVVIASQIKITRYTEHNMKIGSGQKYFIKAVDTSGNYSETAKEATVTIANIPFTNIIEAYSDQTAWAGTKSLCSKVGDNIELDAGELTGIYTTVVRDVGYLASFAIGVNTIMVDATASGTTWADYGSTTFDELADSERFSGSEVVGAVAIEIRVSDDNITWGDWIDWQAGDYDCRYFQLRATLVRETTDKTIQFTELNYYADLPDVDENLDGEVTTASAGDDITFTKTFHEDPSVNVTVLTGTGVYHAISSLDTTGCNVKLYNSSGVLVVGEFRVHIHGV